jgi:hypothetical protein
MEKFRFNQASRRGRKSYVALGGMSVGLLAIFVLPASALANNFKCTASEVAIWPGSRIHVQCSPGDGAITYFAMSVGNPDASRVLSLAEAALAARRPLGIDYTPTDLSGASIGCGNSDCRLITFIGLESQ